MGASSTTGTGPGVSNRPNIMSLQALANAPAVYLAGYVEATESGEITSSPPGAVNSVEFDTPLEGPPSRYVVLLTTLNGGQAYVTYMNENDDGNFSGFTFLVEAECTTMYMVVKIGARA